MNHYSFTDIHKGMKESFQVNITEKMVDSFMELSGDVNPLHTDSEFAKSKGFQDRVVYGMLTSSFLSTLAGVYIPGEKSLIREVEIMMKQPVFIGDCLTVSGEVGDINEDFRFFTLKVSIYNQNNEKVLRGKMQIGVLD